MDISGKNIIITGASSGIGQEILNLLTQYDNVKIVAVARHIETIPIHNNVYALACDVSSKDGVDNVFTFALSVMDNIDIFIANAGYAYLEKINTADWGHIENIFQLNVFSPIYSLEKLLQTESKSAQSFVCTISGAGLVSLPRYSLYCSTKAALHHFVNTYKYEKPKNLNITAVYPIATKTKFFDKASQSTDTPLPFLQQNAKTVAHKIVRGIEKDRKTVYPSFLFRLFYPLGRALPFLSNLYSLNEKRKLKEWLD